jgi:hypothetical protein
VVLTGCLRFPTKNVVIELKQLIQAAKIKLLRHPTARDQPSEKREIDRHSRWQLAVAAAGAGASEGA